VLDRPQLIDIVIGGRTPALGANGLPLGGRHGPM